jgi:hypothetical protein
MIEKCLDGDWEILRRYLPSERRRPRDMAVGLQATKVTASGKDREQAQAPL